MGKAFLIIVVLVIGFAVIKIFVLPGLKLPPLPLDEKLYIAIEGEGTIKVIDTQARKVIKTIDLSMDHEGGELTFSPHNVQVAPDGKSVWVTANVGTHAHSLFSPVLRAYAHGESMEEMMEMMHGEDMPDQVIIIDPATDKIVERIPTAAHAHLAHVVLTPDSAFAYVTAQELGKIYKYNSKTYELEAIVNAPVGSEPHGMRASKDEVYIAMLKGKALGLLNMKTDKLTAVPLRGQAVQAGLTPDGKFAVVSLYDSKELAVYDIQSKKTDYVTLPDGAKGPIQMYPTPDSKFFYLADQGYYFGEPSNSEVYKIELEARKVVREIKAGSAPHGVVVSKDGKMVYVTNLLSGDISVIETTTDAEVARIAVGEQPNGVSLWSRVQGGTP